MSAEPDLQATAAPDPARQARAREYAIIRQRLFFVDLAVSLVLIVGLLATGLSAWLRDQAPSPAALQTAVFFAVLILAYELLLFPLNYYSGFTLPHRYGLATQSFRGWVGDQLKGAGLALVLGVVVLEVIYAFLRAIPDLWWLAAAGFMLFFTVGISMLGRATPFNPSP